MLKWIFQNGREKPWSSVPENSRERKWQQEESEIASMAAKLFKQIRIETYSMREH